jgi:glutaredoxin
MIFFSKRKCKEKKTKKKYYKKIKIRKRTTINQLSSKYEEREKLSKFFF